MKAGGGDKNLPPVLSGVEEMPHIIQTTKVNPLDKALDKCYNTRVGFEVKVRF